MSLLERLKSILREDEGERLSIYRDSRGNLTAGIGHLLTSEDLESKLPPGSRIPKKRVLEWFEQDVSRAVGQAQSVFPKFNNFPEKAQLVVASMAFQLGRRGLSEFQDFAQAIRSKDWPTAIAEMKDSDWAEQTPHRVKRHAKRLRSLFGELAAVPTGDQEIAATSQEVAATPQVAATEAAPTPDPRTAAANAILDRDWNATPQAGIQVEPVRTPGIFADVPRQQQQYAQADTGIATDATVVSAAPPQQQAVAPAPPQQQAAVAPPPPQQQVGAPPPPQQQSLYLSDKFIDAYWYHFSADMQAKSPEFTRDNLAEYVRREESANPDTVKQMGEYLFEKKYRGVAMADGKKLSREDFDKQVGLDVLKSYQEQGDVSKGISTGVQNLRSGFWSSIEGLGKTSGNDTLERWGGEGIKAAGDEIQRLAPEQDITQVDDVESAKTWLKQALGSGAIDLGTTGAGALLGMAILGPPGAVAGGILANLPRLYGSNREAQKEQRKKEGQPEEVDEGKAFSAALGQSVIDYAAERLLVPKALRKAVTKYLTRKGVRPTPEKIAKISAQVTSSVKAAAGRMAKGAVTGAAEEAVAEVSQQVIERFQAGAPLDDAEAMTEYINSLAAGGLIGGVAKSTLSLAAAEPREEGPAPETGTQPAPAPPSTPAVETQPGDESEAAPAAPETVEEIPAADEAAELSKALGEEVAAGPEVQPETAKEPPPAVAKPDDEKTVHDFKIAQDLEAGERQKVEHSDLKVGDVVLLDPVGEAPPQAAVVETAGPDLVRYADQDGNVVGVVHPSAPSEQDPTAYTVKEADIPVDKEAEKARLEVEKREQKVQEYTGHVDASMERLDTDMSNEDDAKMLARHRGSDMFDELPPERQQQIDQTLRSHRDLVDELEGKDKAEQEAFKKHEREQREVRQRQERLDREERGRQEREEREERSRQEREEKGWLQIGTNERGQPLFQDERGVRSYVEKGIRIAETVGVSPKGEISIQPDHRGGEFLTEEEMLPEPEPLKEAAPPVEAAPAPEPEPAVEPDEVIAPTDVAERVADRLETEGFRDIRDARQFVAGLTGEQIAANTPAAKKAEELIESGVVLAARRVVDQGDDTATTFDQLSDLYDKQPRLRSRDSDSEKRQAFSTPIHIAYAAAVLADADRAPHVLEPTAGHGALLVATNPAEQAVLVNEIDPVRVQSLRAQGFKPMFVDAADPDFYQNEVPPVETVIVNPPFGVSYDYAAQKPREWVIEDDLSDTPFRTDQIDQAIATFSLRSMTDDGRAVVIVGGLSKQQTDRAEGYKQKNKRHFYWRIYNAYNVVDHFTLPGQLYEKQGAGWPIDIIVIEGRGKSARPLPMVEPPKIIDLADLRGKLEAYAQSRAIRELAPAREAGQPSPEPDAGVRELEGEPGRGATDRGHGGEQRVSGGPDAAALPAGVDVAPAGDLQRGQREPGDVAGTVPGPALLDRGGVPQPAPEPRQLPESNQGVVEDLDPQEPDDDGVSQVAELAEAAHGERHFVNKPISKNKVIGALVPAMQASAAREQLTKAGIDDVDQFVMTELRYDADADFQQAFSAEQVDSIALGITNLQQGKGFINGDQTGLGKGRFIAAMIRYAIIQGKIPIFITQKPNLYADMWRDMLAIGMPKFLGRNPNILATNIARNRDEVIVVKDPEGNEVEIAGKPDGWLKRQYEGIVKQLGQTDPLTVGDETFDSVFTTYNQLQSKKGAMAARHQFVRRLAPFSYIMMDESHSAGGTETMGDRGPTTSQVPVSDFIFDLTISAQGAIFASATFAKNPYVMSLYANKTGLVQIMPNAGAASRSVFSSTMKAGGLPLQQIVSQQLVGDGQYLRRERDFTGVEFGIQTAESDPAAYTQFVAANLELYEWDRGTAESIKERFLQEQGRMGNVGMADAALGAHAASQVTFGSLMHNLVKSSLVSGKADHAANIAIEAFRNGEKPLIALDSTMEAALTSMGLEVGMPVDLPFGALIRRYLERTLRVTISLGEGETTHQWIPIDFLEGWEREKYTKLHEKLGEIDFPNMPVSPIDWLHYRLRAAGLTTGEITGRQSVFDYTPEAGEADIRRGTFKDREDDGGSPAGRKKMVDKFNSGEIDAIILNRAGATGVSMHASIDFQDQRKRTMIIAEPPGNVDDFMQIVGRTNRVGQVIDPKFVVLSADVPVQRRANALLMGKLKGLNANVTSDQKNDFTADEMVDFTNPIGDEVAFGMGRDPEWIGVINSLGLDEAPKRRFAAKLTGRAILLNVDQQKKLFDELIHRYTSMIQRYEAMGENPLGIKVLDLQAQEISRSVIIEGGSGDSNFAGPAYATQQSVLQINKPYKRDVMLGHVLKAYERELGDLNDREQANLGRALNLMAGEHLGELSKTLPSEVRGDLQETMGNFRRHTMARTDISDDEKDTLFWRKDQELNAGADKFLQFVTNFAPGMPVRLTQNLIIGESSEGSTYSTYGVIVRVPEWNPKNTSRYNMSRMKVHIDLLDGAKEGSYSVSELVMLDNGPGDTSKVGIEHRMFITDGLSVVDAFDSFQKSEREERSIITGNVSKAAMEYLKQGSLVVFTTDKGKQDVGLLMKKDFDVDAAKTKESRSVGQPSRIAEILDYLAPQADNEVARIHMGDDIILDYDARAGTYELAVKITKGSKRRGQAQNFPEVEAVWGTFLKVTGHVDYNPFGSLAWVSGVSRRDVDETQLVDAIQVLMSQGRQMTVDSKHVGAFEKWKGGGRRQRRARADEADSGRPPFDPSPELVTRVYEAAARMVPKNVTVELTESTETGVLGYYESDSERLKPIISIAMSADPVETINHETIHALFDMGLFTRPEIRALVRGVSRGGWFDKHDIVGRYPDLTLAQQVEEAIAEAFGAWENGWSQLPNLFARLFRRIHRFMGEVVMALHIQGIAPSIAATTVFARVHAGTVAQRAESGFYSSGAPATRQRRPESFQDYVEESAHAAGIENASEVAERMAKASKGVTPVGAVAWIMEQLKGTGLRLVRRWEGLKENRRSAEFIERARELLAAEDAARSKVGDYLNAWTKDLNEEEMNVLTTAFVLEDFLWTADQEMEVAFGLSKDRPEEIGRLLAELKRRIFADPKLTDRFNMHYRVLEDMRQEIIENKVLPIERMRNRNYFMHQVLAYAQVDADVKAGIKNKVKTPSYYRRHGSELDINLNYHQVWSKFLYRANVDVATAKFLNWLRRSKYNDMPNFRARARSENNENLGAAFHEIVSEVGLGAVEPLAGAVDSPTSYLRELRKAVKTGAVKLDMTDPKYSPIRQYTGFVFSIARGMSDLSAAVKELSAAGANIIPSRFQGALDSITEDDPSVYGEIGTNDFFRLLDWLLNEDETPALDGLRSPAARILAATGRRKKWTSAYLAEKYVDPLDSEALLRTFGDTKSQALWQADSYDGRSSAVTMHFSHSIPERAFEAMRDRIEDLAGDGEAAVAVNEVAEFLGQIDQVMAIGRPKEQMILGQDLVEALNQIKDPESDARFSKAIQWATQRWKVWTLFNTARFARYIVNNLMGDVDAIGGSGYGKAIFSRIPLAARDLKEFRRTGKASPLLRVAMDRGVLWSSQTIAEFEDIQRNEFSVNQKLKSMPARAVKTYLNAARGLALKRENIFRYAAFLGMHDEIIAKGQNPLERGYGSTPPDIITGLKGIDLVTRMSIDLMGDYWIPQTGRWLRKHLIPFWSWQHSNAIRYIRRVKNIGLYTGHVSKTKGLTLGAWTAASAAIRLWWVYAAYTLWNNLLFGDEEEELSKREQVEPHIILGRTPAGRIVKFRSDFALPDFLGWMDFDGAREVLQEIAVGRATTADLLATMAKGGPNRVINSVTPFYKTGLELYTGRQMWPDATDARPIHDKVAHAASMLSLKGAYVAIAQAFGEPIVGKSLSDQLLATATVDIRDPGEQAYFSVRTKAYDWLEREKGRPAVSRARSERSQLLYYWRRAVRYGNRKAAQEIEDMLQEQIHEETGRNLNPKRYISKSLRSISPLGMMSRKFQAEFKETLTKEERVEFERAQAWFTVTYGARP